MIVYLCGKVKKNLNYGNTKLIRRYESETKIQLIQFHLRDTVSECWNIKMTLKNMIFCLFFIIILIIIISSNYQDQF